MLRSFARLVLVSLALLARPPLAHADPVAPPSPSCALSDLSLSRFPLDGQGGRDWVITNYVDLDPGSPGVADYTGRRGPLARTYDGHTGVDVDIPSFREMDAGVAVIHAAAPGTVDEVVQDQPDRNQRCAGRWNVVGVRLDNGYRVLYGHIKARSATVAVGQRIDAGAPLAIVGSAGCSPQAHLHFEVRDCAGAPVETLLREDAWIAPPPADPPSDVLDVMLRDGAMVTVADIKDPAPDPRTIAAHGPLAIGLSAAVRGGDTVAVALVGPRGGGAPSTATSLTRALTIARGARYGHWYLGFTLTAGVTPGVWTVEVRVNGGLRARRFVVVEPRAPALSRRASPARAGAGSARSSTARAAGSRPRTDRSRPAF
jgi:murein DD-endopeptidase MepM/ murein hydrolase activator NlpD